MNSSLKKRDITSNRVCIIQSAVLIRYIHAELVGPLIENFHQPAVISFRRPDDIQPER